MALEAARKNKKNQRREPKRSGSRETVELIFEATARILAAHGRAGLNTNRIAEVAGVSFGSLFGYFPNKQAILLAMARRELDHLRDRVKAALALRRKSRTRLFIRFKRIVTFSCQFIQPKRRSRLRLPGNSI